MSLVLLHNIFKVAIIDYNLDGNLTSDKNKGIKTIKYNHLNLPTVINFGGGNKIKYFYDAVGTKLKKQVTDTGNVTTTEYTANGAVYENDALQFMPTAEGYITPVIASGSVAILSFNYVYQYKDHLESVRLSYSDIDGNGSINLATEILQERNNYPFGMRHSGYNNNIIDVENNYKTFQGQEISKELGYNMLEFKYRHYDPEIARFVTLDPLATEYPFNSTYAFQENKLGLGRELEGLELARDSRYAVLQGFQKMFQAAGRSIDNLGGEFKGFFVIGDGSSGKVNGTKGTVDNEKGISLKAGTTVEEFFTRNSNWNTPVSNSPLTLEVELTDKTNVSVSGTVTVEGVDLNISNTTSQDNTTGQVSNNTTVTIGKGNDGVYVKGGTDGVKARVKADVEIEVPSGSYIKFGFDASIGNEK